jgi:AcrR family transcriptional regulator
MTANGAVPTHTGSMVSTTEPARGGRPRDPAADHALVTATLETLRDDGYAGLSMSGVAKRAGVSATTLYRRWSSKEDMVAAAVATLSPVIDRLDTGTLAGDLRAALRQRAKALRSDEGKVVLGLIARDRQAPRHVYGRQRTPHRKQPQRWRRHDQTGHAPRRDPPIDLALAVDVIAGPFWSRLVSGTTPTNQFVAALKTAPTPRSRRAPRQATRSS